ncbi:MAG: type III secretion system export apparatus subunit SctR [Methyloligellaceae bacterium]
MADNLSLVIIGFLSGLVVITVLTTTAFTKLSIVFFVIRNALGMQQAPGNTILHTFALVLAIYISLPVFTEVYDIAITKTAPPKTLNAWVELLTEGSEPIKTFLKKNTDEGHKEYFQSVTKEVWKGSSLKADKNDLIILIPSFMITELTRAFEIGFLLYLPFVAVDIILTAILMAMGMMMVPPSLIGVPFKLLLFIMIGGWTKLVQGLVLTYGG